MEVTAADEAFYHWVQMPLALCQVQYHLCIFILAPGLHSLCSMLCSWLLRQLVQAFCNLLASVIAYSCLDVVNKDLSCHTMSHQQIQ